MNKITLHKNKVEEFKQFLDSRGIAYRPGKGDYQVLQVKTHEKGWQAIYAKNHMPEHYTVNQAMMPLVRAYLNDRKLPNKILVNLGDRVHAISNNVDYEAKEELAEIAEELWRMGGKRS